MWKLCEIVIEGVFFLAFTFGALYISERIFGTRKPKQRIW